MSIEIQQNTPTTQVISKFPRAVDFLVFFGSLVAWLRGSAWIYDDVYNRDDGLQFLILAVQPIVLVIVASVALRKRVKNLAGAPRVILIRDVQMLTFGFLITPMAWPITALKFGLREQTFDFLIMIVMVAAFFLLAHIFARLVSGNAPIIGGLAVVSAFGALYFAASSVSFLVFGGNSRHLTSFSNSKDFVTAGTMASAVGMLANSVCVGLLGARVFVKQAELREKLANYSFYALAGYTGMSALGRALWVFGMWPEKGNNLIDYRRVFGVTGIGLVFFLALATESIIKFIQKPMMPELSLPQGVSDVTPMPHVGAMPGMPAMPEPQFMVSIAGQRVGPFPVSHLTSFVSNGQVTVETMVWTQGMAEWLAAGKVPALGTLFEGVAPPLPPA